MMKRHKLFAPIIPLLLLATSLITVHASELDRNNTNKTETLYFSKTREKVTEGKEELYQKLLRKCRLLEQEKRKLQDELQKEKNNNSNKKSGPSSIYVGPWLAYTPLHDAAQQGKIKALEELWKDSYYRWYLNNQHNKDQRTPLLCALKKKQWQAAKWLINKGAWIDVADTNGDTCLQLLLRGLNPNTPDLAQLVVTLMSQRTLFPIERIKAHLLYTKEKEQGQETYDQKLCSAVAQLLGEPVDELSRLLHDANNRELYRAAANNILSSKQEGHGNVTFTQGWSIDFLKFRIAVLYNLLVRVKKQHFISQLPMKKNSKQHYCNDEVYEKGVKELQVMLTTFWDHKTLEGCLCSQDSSFYKAWAQGIIHRLPNLRFPQEISLALSHYGQCIYVSLTNTSTHYIVRVDNRWINTAPKKSHPLKKQTFYQKEITCLQPYAVAYFPIRTWGKHKVWLLNYIACAGQLNGQHSSKVIPHFYQTKQKPPKIGDKPTWAKTWPWRPLETTAENCFMRSHNVGYRIRLGNELYEWFRQKSLGSYLLEQKFLKKQPSSYKRSSNDEEETKEE